MKICPHCKGQMVREEDVWVCLQCSREWRSPHALNKFYELHKQEIIADYYGIGPGKTRTKWRISTGGWYRISKRWYLGKSKEEVLEPHDELIFLKGYRACLTDLIKGGAKLNLRNIDSRVLAGDTNIKEVV